MQGTLDEDGEDGVESVKFHVHAYVCARFMNCEKYIAQCFLSLTHKMFVLQRNCRYTPVHTVEHDGNETGETVGMPTHLINPLPTLGVLV